MSIKYVKDENGLSKPFKTFDKARTLGTLKFLEIKPVLDFEDQVDEETGEMKRLPTGDILEYLVHCDASVGSKVDIAVPVDAKGLSIDANKYYRKPIVFQDMTVNMWQRRETDFRGNRVIVSDNKFRATDFKPLEEQSQAPKSQGQVKKEG